MVGFCLGDLAVLHRDKVHDLFESPQRCLTTVRAESISLCTEARSDLPCSKPSTARE